MLGSPSPSITEKINGTAPHTFEKTTYLTADSASSCYLLPYSIEVEKSLVLLICVKPLATECDSKAIFTKQS